MKNFSLMFVFRHKGRNRGPIQPKFISRRKSTGSGRFLLDKALLFTFRRVNLSAIFKLFIRYAFPRRSAETRAATLIQQAAVIFLTLMFLWNPPPSSASDFDIKWNGHLRGQGSKSWYSTPHILELINDTGPFLDGGLDGRLNGTLFAGNHFTFEVNYEAVVSGGQSRETFWQLLHEYPDLPSLSVGAPSDDRRFFSLTHVISDKENHVFYHRLDRLAATYAGEQITFRAGRQALTWGNGLIFNPMDLLNPFAPSDVIRDYKIGDDMLVMQGYYGPFSDLQLAYVARRNPETGNVSGSEASFAGKAKWTAFESDWDAMVTRHYEDTVLGVGMVRYIKDAAWRADVTFTAMDGNFSNGFFSAVTNLDYSWVWGGFNFYGLCEFYYNGLGHNDPADALQDVELLKRMDRGELYALGKWYTAGQIQFEAHPLVNLYVSAIVNLDDPSMLLQPRVVWDVLSSARVMAGVDIPTGADGTEYGGPINPLAGKPAGSPTKAYVICTWYF